MSKKNSHERSWCSWLCFSYRRVPYSANCFAKIRLCADFLKLTDYLTAMKSASFSILSRFRLNEGWTYRFIVMLTDECPKISLSVLMSILASTQRVANVWRKTWKFFLSMPHFLRILWKRYWMRRGSTTSDNDPLKKYPVFSIGYWLKIFSKVFGMGITRFAELLLGAAIMICVFLFSEVRFCIRCIVWQMQIVLSEKEIFSHVSAHNSPTRIPVYRQMRIPRLRESSWFTRHSCKVVCSDRLKISSAFGICLTRTLKAVTSIEIFWSCA